MNAIVFHVEAVFGGKRLRFELCRDRATVDKLEAAVGSVSACWGRFNTGDWTLADVRTVLALAHPAPVRSIVRGAFVPDPPKSISDVARQLAGLGPAVPREVPQKEALGVPPELIDRHIATRPLATYAALAGAILSAAFTGRFDDGWTFDEDAPLIAAPAEPAAVAA